MGRLDHLCHEAEEAFHPRVSTIIPVWNGVDFLAEAVQSALDQTYDNHEIIVVNDGSCDNGATAAIARRYGDKIRYFEKPNGGVATALNFAVEHMTGDYFSWLSHDDLYTPAKVSSHIRELAKQGDPDCCVLYGDYLVFTDDPDNANLVSIGSRPPSEFRLFITRENILHGCTLLVPRVAFLAYGGFNTSLKTTQDYDLWFRMAETCQFIHQSVAGVKARRHQNQGTRKMSDIVLREGDALLVGFVDALTGSELLATGASSVGEAYRLLSDNLASRGFANASARAAVLAMGHGVLSSAPVAGDVADVTCDRLEECPSVDDKMNSGRSD